MDETPVQGREAAPCNMPALYAALANAQSEFQPIPKNKTVTIKPRDKPSYNFKYADLEAVLTATRPALAKNGLAVVQVISGQQLITQLVHAEGGVISSIMDAPSGFNDIKSYGASITYLRRYAYCALLCVAADDDLDENGEPTNDQQKSSQRKPRAQKQEQQQPQEQQQYLDDHLQEPLPIDEPGNSDPVTAGMVGVIQAKLKAASKSADDFLAHFSIAAIDELPRSRMNDAMDWIKQ